MKLEERRPAVYTATLSAHELSALLAGARMSLKLMETDETGSKILDSQWGPKRSIYMEDIATTIYSAMGIDWKKTIKATPSGREFYYLEPFAAKAMIGNREISPLFG